MITLVSPRRRAVHALDGARRMSLSTARSPSVRKGSGALRTEMPPCVVVAVDALSMGPKYGSWNVACHVVMCTK